MTPQSEPNHLAIYAADCVQIINQYVRDWFAPLGIVVNVRSTIHSSPTFAHLSLSCDWLTFTVDDHHPQNHLPKGELTLYSAHNLAYVYCAWLKSSIAFRNHDTIKEYRGFCGVPKNTAKPAFRTNIFVQQFHDNESDISFRASMEQAMTLFPPSFISPERDEIMRNEIDIRERAIAKFPFVGAPFEDEGERDEWIMNYAKRVHRTIHTSPAARIIGVAVKTNEVANKAVVML